MGQIDLPELTQILENQELILNRFEDLQNRMLPEWVDLRTACEYKGVNYNTVTNRPALQPDRTKRRKVTNIWRWPRDEIIAWSKKSDDELGYQPNPKKPKLKVAG